MNNVITFLVGNGFDLNLGAKTTYRDFFSEYKKNKRNLKISAEIERLEELRDQDKKVGKWCDLEEILGELTLDYDKDSYYDFIAVYRDILDSLNEYIKKQEEIVRINAYGEEAIERTRKNLRKFYNDLGQNDAKPFEKNLEEDGRNSIEIKFISFNYTYLLDDLIMEVSKKDLREWLYTDDVTHETIKCKLYVNPTVLHIHGTYDSFPVLGVNSEDQIKNEDLMHIDKVRKILIKRENERAIGRNSYEEAYSTIINSKYVCIYGMSLGETDNRTWETIAEWLFDRPYGHLIVFSYDSNVKKLSPDYLIREQFQDKFINLMPKLKEADKERLEPYKSRIHVVFNSNIFDGLIDKAEE